MLVADLSTKPIEWQTVPVPFRRRAVVAGTRNGKLYVLGGLTPAGKMSQAMHVYDSKTSTWSEGPDLPFKGFGAGCTNVGGELIAAGMGGGVFRLSAAGDAWEQTGSMHFHRFFHRMVPLDDHRCLAFGGAGTVGHMRTIEVLDVRAPSGTAKATTWTVPCPGLGNELQHSTLNRGELVLVGRGAGTVRVDLSHMAAHRPGGALRDGRPRAGEHQAGPQRHHRLGRGRDERAADAPAPRQVEHGRGRDPRPA